MNKGIYMTEIIGQLCGAAILIALIVGVFSKLFSAKTSEPMSKTAQCPKCGSKVEFDGLWNVICEGESCGAIWRMSSEGELDSVADFAQFFAEPQRPENGR